MPDVQRLLLLAAASRLIGPRSITAIRALTLATAQRLVSGEQRTMAADRSLDVRCHLVRTGACDPLLSLELSPAMPDVQRLPPAVVATSCHALLPQAVNRVVSSCLTRQLHNSRVRFSLAFCSIRSLLTAQAQLFFRPPRDVKIHTIGKKQAKRGEHAGVEG